MLPTSVKLGLIALLWATLVGVPLGSLAAYRSGDLDFVNSAPQKEIKKLLDTKELKTLPYVGTYYVCFDTQKKPLDDPKVRKAFSLAIDRNFIVDQVTGRGEKVASGYVPSGVYDEKGTKGDDFRTVGGDYYSVKSEDYEKNIKEAKKLMEEAGFKDGKGFPQIEYLYNTDDNHKAIAEALQNMWLTGGGNNDAQYKNKEFDKYVKAAKATSNPKERMENMHKAEDILIKDDLVVAPIYFYVNPYMMKPNIKGMYYTPLGYFFFKSATGF